MADISKSTTRTTRGEGHAATQNQISSGKAERKKGASKQTRTETMPSIISTVLDTPGKTVTVTKDENDGKSSTQSRPEITSRKTDSPAEIKTVSAPTVSEKIDHEDHGIKVTLKFKINAFQ
jgi:hypothetical protein